MTPKQKSLLVQWLTLNNEIDRLKRLYELRDQCVVALQKDGFTVADHDGRIYDLVDNYEAKNTVFKACGVNRFEIKERKLPKEGK